MKSSLKEIFDKFLTIFQRWQLEKMTGKLTIEVHLVQGGIADWSILTKGKDE